MGRKKCSIILAALLSLTGLVQLNSQEVSELSITIRMISSEEVEEVIELSAMAKGEFFFIFPISYEVSDLHAEALNEERFPVSVRLESVKGKYFIVVTKNKSESGIIRIRISFKARGMIERASNKYIFSQSFSTPYDVSDMTVTVVLPGKFSILSPIYPSPDAVLAVGKEISVVWSYGPIKAGQEEFVILGFREDYNRFFWVPYAITSLIASFLAGLVVGRRLKRTKYVTLVDEEKVLQVLRERGSVTQAELADILGFSKAKLSKLLNQMERSGLIRRERYKRTFIVTLSERMSHS